jgi:hypothetical protein
MQSTRMEQEAENIFSQMHQNGTPNWAKTEYVNPEEIRKEIVPEKNKHTVLKIVVVLFLIMIAPTIFVLLFAILEGIASAFSAIASNAELGRHIIVLLIAIAAMCVGCPYFFIRFRQECRMEDPISRLRALDKKNLFSAQIAKAENYYGSLKLHKSQNKNEKITNETVKDAYAEIYRKIENQLELISNYIEHFDYVANQTPDQGTLDGIGDALAKMDDLIDKLNRLDTINIKLENSALDNDTDRIRFLVEAMEELNDEEH